MTRILFTPARFLLILVVLFQTACAPSAPRLAFNPVTFATVDAAHTKVLIRLPKGLEITQPPQVALTHGALKDAEAPTQLFTLEKTSGPTMTPDATQTVFTYKLRSPDHKRYDRTTREILGGDEENQAFSIRFRYGLCRTAGIRIAAPYQVLTILGSASNQVIFLAENKINANVDIPQLPYCI